ncbi:MAG: hypothetical protein GDA53_10710 [Rhodobacteraceae bacterium]|nr:hypothetical protein [Paracoccaceae bacterium]
MNAVEIEEAVSNLADRPFDAAEFPFAFLKAFGNRDTTIRRLRTGATNGTDMGGVCQKKKIHIKTCAPGDVPETIAALRGSQARAQFILATDGRTLEAEDTDTGESLACAYGEVVDNFGFFLPLAGISTVREIRENTFDIRAVGRLDKLYVALLRYNPDWGRADHRHQMNHFMARLIFCFFAEKTGIFKNTDLFTETIARMTAQDSSNTTHVIGEIFRAMNTPPEARDRDGL